MKMNGALTRGPCTYLNRRAAERGFKRKKSLCQVERLKKSLVSVWTFMGTCLRHQPETMAIVGGMREQCTYLNGKGKALGFTEQS